MSVQYKSGEASVKPVAIIAVHGVGDPKPGVTSDRLAGLLLKGSQNDQGTRQLGFERSNIQIAVNDDWSIVDVPSVQQDYSIAHSASALTDVASKRVGSTYHSVLHRGKIQSSSDSSQPIELYEFNWADLSRAPSVLATMIVNLYQLGVHFSILAQRAIGLAKTSMTKAPEVSASSESRPYDQNITPPTDPFDISLVHLSDLIHQVGQWFLPTTIPVLNYFLFAAALPLLGLYLPECMDGVAGATVVGLILLVLTARVKIGRTRQGPLVAVAVALIYGLGMLTVGTEWRLGLLGFMILLVGMLLAAWASLETVRRRNKLLKNATHAIMVAVPVYWLYSLYTGYTDPATQSLYDQMLLASASVVHALFFLLQLGWAALWFVMMGAWLLFLVSRLKQRSSEVLWVRALFTGALGVTLSATVFFMLTIILWAAILDQVSVELSQQNLHFDPLFPLLYRDFVDVSDNVLLAEYVNDLFRLTTGDGANGFLIAIVLSAFICFAAMLPSAWYERHPGTLAHRMEDNSTHYLKRWLDDGFFALSVAVGVLVLGFIWLGFGYWLPYNEWDPLHGVLVGQDLVVWLGTGLAGAIPLFLLFRSQLPSAARSVLDILLDVDNWLRDMADRASPRGLILARYLSLLRVIAHDDRYKRIVIVAHSQGTVITGDMLRLLQAQPALANEVFGSQAPEIRLVTAGSPLRQLYSRRFPHEYAWVEGERGQGPELSELFGVTRWINLFNTGDYVGRELWSDPPQMPWRPSESPLDTSQANRDILLGAGAHTHYFDGDDPRVYDVIWYQLTT